jgi:hypothetical protein
VARNWIVWCSYFPSKKENFPYHVHVVCNPIEITGRHAAAHINVHMFDVDYKVVLCQIYLVLKSCVGALEQK